MAGGAPTTNPQLVAQMMQPYLEQRALDAQQFEAAQNQTLNVIMQALMQPSMGAEAMSPQDAMAPAEPMGAPVAG